MNKLTKGALTMVLVGSITFSVTNALLADHSSKRLAQANDLTNSGDQKKADDINKAEKTVKNQTPTPDVKDVQPTHFHNIAVFQAAVLNNGNKSDKAIAVNQKNTKTISATSTTFNTPAPATTITTNSNTPTTGTTSTKSATTTATKNSTATANSTTKAITTTPTTTTMATTTTTATKTTNHGKQVSQSAKEKAASHQIKKINY
ncbi:hypothetical protein NDK43_09520 [Neobacillus pocheonensis]|uniref:Extracellular protein n=1 Tax=Neobacillus pocheonensis TaxID=363869 RepID=A0ABT0W932_9BACI|nr:hypothetical protein [Neobacillus pocheonensis]